MFAYKLFSLASVLGLVLAQGQPPECATSCMMNNIGASGGSCGTTDFGCLCKNQPFVTAIYGCLQSTCGSGTADQAVAYASSLCQNAGVDISSMIPGIAASSASASVATGMSSVANEASSAASGAASSAANEASNTVSSAASVASSAASHASSAASDAASHQSSHASSAASSVVASSTGAASSLKAAGGLALAAAGAVALF